MYVPVCDDMYFMCVVVSNIVEKIEPHWLLWQQKWLIPVGLTT
jgi:hypothetical protein